MASKPLVNKNFRLYFFLSLAILAGLLLRFYRLGNAWLTCETQNFLWGIRLHHLAWFNLNDILLNNFFKSFFGTLGGIRYALSAYLFSSIYKVLHIPLTEYWILAFHASLGTILIFVTYMLGKKWGNAAVGVLAAIWMAISPGAILSSRWDNSEPLVSLTMALSAFFLFSLGRTSSLLKALAFGILLSILVSMESIMGAPLLLLYSYFVLAPSEGNFKDRIRSYFEYVFGVPGIIALIPVILTLAMHYWTWRRVGVDSHLGMFGLMSINYSDRLTLSTFFPRLLYVINHYAEYFGSRLFYSTIVAGALVVFRRGLNLSWVRYPFLGATYFFVAFVFLPNTLSHAEHLYICESITALCFASIWWEVWHFIKKDLLERLNLLRFKLFASNLVPICLLAAFFVVVTSNAVEDALKRPQFIHPMKSVGYYIRHFGGTDSTVMNLMSCNDAVCINQMSEYYYGKQLVDVHDPLLFPRKLFCSGTASPKEIAAAYNAKDFTFYVHIKSIYWLYGGNRRVDGMEALKQDEPLRQVLQIPGIHKVADVKNGNEVLAEIYSTKNFPFISMELNQYDRLWAKDYGDYNRIIEGRRVGIISTFGPHFDRVVGY